MKSQEIQDLIKILSKLPGLGPRSGRRAGLALMKEKTKLMAPLLEALRVAYDNVQTCITCGNLDVTEECSVCSDQRRDKTKLCVVEDVSDLWALERSASYRGMYHIIGGTLSALDGRGPDDLNLASLLTRLGEGGVDEVILALGATMEGQTTAHYIIDRLASFDVKTTVIAHGIPVGGELDFLDDGTLTAALNSRRAVY